MAPSIDEFEDLTQFADESFDTGEVDLFEFADDEDSPLLRLKSIVLSLDWDITEEILNELNEELASLRNLWKDDKVAQIYLQGMENVGKYMRTEGAYAHPNAIKLLLTLYHNFEKIISSANISSESVTLMLKADIRKFKVLQYQISALKKAKGDQEPPPAAEDEEVRQESKPVPPQAAKEKKSAKSGATAAPPPPPAKKKESGMSVPLRSMEATILGLEWEVTDEGLEKFSTEAAELRKHLSDNKEAQVLIQGLQALGAYIREQKTESHPDAFTILHSFYDALKMLLDSPDLGAAQRRQILIEQISSLNSLKEVIARSAASKTTEEDEDDEQEESEDEEAPAPTNAEADEEREEFAFGDEDEDDFSGAKSKTKEEAPAPIATPAAKPLASAQPAEASSDDDDEFDDDLFAQDGGGVKPALADEDEDGSFAGSLTSEELSGDKAVELDEKLDSFFNFGDEEEQPQKTVKAPKAPVQPEEKKPAAEVKKSVKSSLANFLETKDEEVEDEEDDDIDSSFFNFTDDDESSAVAAGATAAAAADSLHFDDELFGGSAAKQAISADEEENHGLAAVSKEDEEDNDDDELDAFFNFDDELDDKAAPPSARPVAPTPALADEEESPLGLSAGIFGSMDEDAQEQEQSDDTQPALADEDEELDDEAAVSADSDDLADGLDSFFSFDEDNDKTASPAAAAPPTPALADEEESPLGLSAGIFGGMDDDAQEQEQYDDTQPALADEDEEPDDEVAVSADSDEIADGLDSFFSFDEEASPAAAAPPTPALADEEESPLGLSAGLFDGMDDDAQELEQADDTQPALADEDEEPEDEAAISADSDEIADGLDSFFSFDEDNEKIASPAAAAPSTPALADEEESPLGLSAGLFSGMDEDAQEQEQSDDTDDTQPALADEDEEPDDEVAVSTDSDEIADGLDSFFSFDEDNDKIASLAAAAPSTPALAADEEESPLGLSAGLFGGMDEDAQEQEQSDDTDDTQPALADEDEELDDEAAVSADSDEIADGLDSFFSFDEDDNKTTSPATAAPPSPALADEEESPLGLSAGFLSMEERNEPAVASEDAEVGIDTARAAEIKNKLDTLFNFEDEGPSVEDESAADESFAEELPELADELITPLDDDDASSSGPAAAFVDSDDTLFGADTADSTFTADSKADAQQEEDFFAFGSSDADDEPVAAALPDTSAEESEAEPDDALAESDGQHDAFFVFGDLDKESEEEDEPVATDEDSALFAEEADADLLAAATDSKSEEPQEEFFAFSGTESEEELPTTEEETTSAALLADDEQDELFSLKMEEESAEEVVGESEPEDDLLLGEEYEEQSGTALLFGQDSLADPFASVQEKEEEEASNVNVAWPEERAEDVDVAEIFSSLAAVAAALPSTPSEHHLRQVSELAAAARSSSSLPPHQAIVLDLLDTSSALLAKAPQTAVSGGAIVQELAAGLNKAEEPSALAEMISHYTSWQKDFFSQLLRDGQHDEDVSDNVSPQSLAQLRQEMLEEFRQLRQEMLALRR